MALAALLSAQPASYSVPLPKSEALRKTESPKNAAQTVRSAVQAIEGTNSNPLPAAEHSWALWRSLNRLRTDDFIAKGQRALFPDWLTWCDSKDAFGAKLVQACFPDHKNTLHFREDYWDKRFYRPKFGVSSPKKSSNNVVTATFTETIHVSPELARSIRNLLDPEGKCALDSNGVPPGQSIIQCSIDKYGKQYVSDILKSEKLDKNSMVVKASWLHVSPGKDSSILGLNKWIGVESWKDLALAGQPVDTWSSATWNNIMIPNNDWRSKMCGGTRGGSLDYKQFFYVQFCDEEMANHLQGANTGDVLLLHGLHVMTNLQPDGNWTWSTFYWHPEADDVDDPVLSDRAKKIQSARPNGMNGWLGNYRLDLQYSPKEEMKPDPLLVNALATHGALKECEFGPDENPKPPVMFNPYVEGRRPCGGYSNCMSCHSHARKPLTPPTGDGNINGLNLPVNRRLKDPKLIYSDAILTHFLWSLADPR